MIMLETGSKKMTEQRQHRILNGLDQLKTSTKEKRTAVDEVRQYSYDANGNQTDVKNTKTGQTESYVIN